MPRLHLKQVFINGLSLALPLSIVLFLLYKITELFKKVIGPLAKHYGFDQLFGELTLLVLLLLFFLLLVVVLGVLLQLRFMAAFKNNVEAIALKFFPSFNQVKMMMADRLNREQLASAWRPMVLWFEDRYSPAFLIEEKNGMLVFFIIKGNSFQEGEIVVIPAAGARFAEVDAVALKKCVKNYGQGLPDLIKAHLL
jgi:hypothetical protein